MLRSHRRRFVPTVEVLESRLAPSVAAEVVSPPAAAIAPDQSGPTPSAWAFAPYIDVVANNGLQLLQQGINQGTRYFNLAFVQSDASGNPVWGNNAYSATSGAFVTQLQALIAQDRALGGDVAVSFGGYNACVLGQELAITNTTALQAAYQSVITTYGLQRIDFDIEANAVTDQASVSRRDVAIAALESANPGLQVTYTLHADPAAPNHGVTGGMPAGQVALLKDAIANGVTVTEVNLMTMDYGSWWVTDGGTSQRSLGTCSISAASAANLQLQGLFGINPSQAWGMEGITEHIGTNAADTGTFTQTDAIQVLQYIQTVHPATISMWSINKDAELYKGAFGNIFSQYPTGALSAPVSSPTPSSSPEILSPPADPLGPAQNPVAASAWGFAPYIDVVSNNGLQLLQQAINRGTRYFNLAFVQSDASGNPFWGNAFSATSGTFVTQLQGLIAQVRANGGVAVSFGGNNACEQKRELAQVITNTTTLQAAYQSIITTYNLKRIDFDIENIAVTDSASVARRDTAIAALEKANPGLQVTYTLHADPSVPNAATGGMPAGQVALLKDAIAKGVVVTEVNLMTMDYGSWWVSGRPLGTCSILAAQAANVQLQGLFGLTPAQAWAKEGITEHIGLNAAGTGTFSPADAREVYQKLIQKVNPATISFWSINKDYAPPYHGVFTSIFQGKSFATLGTGPNQTYVGILYEDLLGRTADSGAVVWVNMLNAGVPRQTVVQDIENSPEYANDEVFTLYEQYLNRAPDPGAQGWVNALLGGATIEQVIAGIVSSPEYFALKGGTAQDFLYGLYNDILNRSPDSAGLNAWSQSFSTGSSRAAVAAAFLASQEYRSNLVAADYENYLGRPADAGGEAFWLASLNAGLTDQALLAAILGSAESFANRS